MLTLPLSKLKPMSNRPYSFPWMKTVFFFCLFIPAGRIKKQTNNEEVAILSDSAAISHAVSLTSDKGTVSPEEHSDQLLVGCWFSSKIVRQKLVGTPASFGTGSCSH